MVSWRTILPTGAIPYSPVPLNDATLVHPRSSGSSARSSSSRSILEEHEVNRRINIPYNIFGLAIVAPMEDAFGLLHNSLIMTLTMATTCAQFAFIYYMHSVTVGIINDTSAEEAVCSCSRLLQFLCTFCYVMIIWEEIAITLDLIEIIWQAQNKDHTSDMSKAWTVVDEQQVLCCDMGWHMLMSNEHVIYQRQLDGFDISDVPFRWKVVLILYVVAPKLVLELGLLYAGSQYIVVSPNNESIITSVCSVNFIITLDEIVLNAFIPVRYKRAMRETLFSYEAHSRLARLISHIRTDWRPFLDPLICLSLAFGVFKYTLNIVGCDEARLW